MEMKKLIAGALLGSMLACTTLRPVADYEQYVRASQPRQIWVTPHDAKPVLLEAPRFVHDTLVGFVAGRYWEFAPGDLRQVQVREPANGRTAFLIGAAIAVSAVLVAVLASGGPDSYIPTPEDPATSRQP